MYSVYQHWDPLKVCVVGRSYPPEFYNWIKVPHVRRLFERIAIETEEDLQKIATVLETFGVEVLRPEIPAEWFNQTRTPFTPPPLQPRDIMVMIGETFYRPTNQWEEFYKTIKDPSWPRNPVEITDLPSHIQQECLDVHNWLDASKEEVFRHHYPYKKIFDRIQSQGNIIKTSPHPCVQGMMTSRIGKDLYFATESYADDQNKIKQVVTQEFPNNRTHIINTGGHGDAVYCPVTPGLIISLKDVPTYAETFPGWEVVYLPGQSWDHIKPFKDLKAKNNGKWWIPGFEYDQNVIDVVETWLGHWTGYVEETVFDVNMLIIDPKNVIVFNYNDQVFEALSRHGITPHVINFRHRYVWDGGIHCVTLDLHREGVMQDFFPNRK